MTALTLYLANAASTTIATANQLYHNGAGSPTTAQPVTTMGTSINYGEILSQCERDRLAIRQRVGVPTGCRNLRYGQLVGERNLIRILTRHFLMGREP
jgi:hypothetical protein